MVKNPRNYVNVEQKEQHCLKLEEKRIYFLKLTKKPNLRENRSKPRNCVIMK